jgi:hypothetical protein
MYVSRRRGRCLCRFVGGAISSPVPDPTIDRSSFLTLFLTGQVQVHWHLRFLFSVFSATWYKIVHGPTPANTGSMFRSKRLFLPRNYGNGRRWSNWNRSPICNSNSLLFTCHCHVSSREAYQGRGWCYNNTSSQKRMGLVLYCNAYLYFLSNRGTAILWLLPRTSVVDVRTKDL